MEGLAPSHIAQYDGVPLDPIPSSRQGYGRARLSTTLPLANGAGGSDTGNLNLQASCHMLSNCCPARLVIASQLLWRTCISTADQSAHSLNC